MVSTPFWCIPGLWVLIPCASWCFPILTFYAGNPGLKERDQTLVAWGPLQTFMSVHQLQHNGQRSPFTIRKRSQRETTPHPWLEQPSTGIIAQHPPGPLGRTISFRGQTGWAATGVIGESVLMPVIPQASGQASSWEAGGSQLPVAPASQFQLLCTAVYGPGSAWASAGSQTLHRPPLEHKAPSMYWSPHSSVGACWGGSVPHSGVGDWVYNAQGKGSGLCPLTKRACLSNLSKISEPRVLQRENNNNTLHVSFRDD